MNRRALVVGATATAAAVFAAGAFLYSAREDDAASVEGTVLVRPHSPVIGPTEAPVTIVEFLDPSCEACAAFYPIVKQIMDAFPGKTRLVIRYAPLHDGSDEAVRILEAARLQDKFVPVLERLFLAQSIWAMHGAPDLAKAWGFAIEAGLDESRARTDAQSAAITAVLEQDIADMEAVKLEGTPTFFVNGKPLVSFGPQELADLVAVEVAAAGGSAGQ